MEAGAGGEVDVERRLRARCVWHCVGGRWQGRAIDVEVEVHRIQNKRKLCVGVGGAFERQCKLAIAPLLTEYVEGLGAIAGQRRVEEGSDFDGRAGDQEIAIRERMDE